MNPGLNSISKCCCPGTDESHPAYYSHSSSCSSVVTTITQQPTQIDSAIEMAPITTATTSVAPSFECTARADPSFQQTLVPTSQLMTFAEILERDDRYYTAIQSDSTHQEIVKTRQHLRDIYNQAINGNLSLQAKQEVQDTKNKLKDLLYGELQELLIDVDEAYRCDKTSEEIEAKRPGWKTRLQEAQQKLTGLINELSELSEHQKSFS